jgi:sortase (surface protein transpeptidase)
VIATGVTIDATVPPAIVRPAPAATPAAGAILGRVAIPRLDLSAGFRHGVGSAVLAKGPGHYPGTSLPGAGGTVALAGHRVTHTRRSSGSTGCGKGMR